LPVGTACKVSNRKGNVRFNGETKFAPGIWIGIELDDAVGRNDGNVQGVQYFDCKDKHGIFVRPSQVTPEDTAASRQSVAKQRPSVAPRKSAALPDEAAAPKAGGKAHDVAAAMAHPPKSPKAPEAAAAKAHDAAAAKAGKAAPVAKGMPKHVDSKHADAKHAEPLHGEHKHLEHKHAEPAKAPDAKHGALPTVPAHAEQKHAEQKYAEHKHAEHKHAEPAKAPDAKHVAVPTVPEASPGEPETHPRNELAKQPREAKAKTRALPGRRMGVADDVHTEEVAHKLDETEKAKPLVAETKTAPIQLPPDVLEELKALKADSTRLSSEVASREKLLTEVRKQRTDLQGKDSNIKCQEGSDLQRRINEAREAEAKLQTELAAVRSKREGLQAESVALQAELKARRDKALSEAGMTIEDAPEIERLSFELQLERESIELLELKNEELSLQIADVQDALNAAREDAAAAESGDLSAYIFDEDEKLKLHKDALRRAYDEHRSEMRKLKKRVDELERQAASELTRSSGMRDEDVAGLQRAKDLLLSQNASLDKTLTTIQEAVDERRKLQKTNDEMAEEYLNLETALSEELERGLERERRLEQLARKLCRGREELKGRRAAQRAILARMELRVQDAQSRAGNAMGGKPEKKVPDDLNRAELDVALMAADSRADAVLAEARVWCLPEAVREEAEVGESFYTLCALHRCFHKAQILSGCIHEYYIQDATLAMLPGSSTSMTWICRSCLSSCQAAYFSVGILGRLRDCEVERYVKVIRMPTVRACATGENAFDAALGVLSGSSSSSPEVLAALSAHGAQLLSLQNSVFKDEPFVSFQTAGCAVEALRAVCSMALYSSEDAGGSRRKEWQKLHTRADRLSQRLMERSRKRRGGSKSIVLFDVEARLGLKSPSLDAAADFAQADDEPSAEASPSRKKKGAKEAEDGLNPAALEALLQHVATLESLANREPGPDEDARSDALDKSLAQANHIVDGLEEFSRNTPDEKLPELSQVQLPWVGARDSVRRKIEDAETGAQEELSLAEKECKKARAKLSKYDEQLCKVLLEVAEVERAYSVARISAEGFQLVDDSVKRMRIQAQYHVTKHHELQEELKKEEEKKSVTKKQTVETQRRCNELQHQIAERERRLAKRYSSNISPDEVIALRQACLRHRGELLEANHRRWPSFVENPDSLAELFSSGKGDGNEGADPGQRLSSCLGTLQEVQGGLLLEQASTRIVDLADTLPAKATDEQRERLTALAKKSGELNGSVTSLLREVAGVGDQSGGPGGARFAPLPLSRHLKATADAALRGPLARMLLPPPAKGRPSPAVSLAVLADLEQTQELHRVLL